MCCGCQGLALLVHTLEDECWDADVAEEDEHTVTPKCDLERHVFPLLPEADDRGWAGRAPADKRAPA